MMKAQYTINNYVLGARLKMTPVHKIIKQYRKDSRYTIVIYQDLTPNEFQFINKILGRKGTITSLYGGSKNDA